MVERGGVGNLSGLAGLSISRGSKDVPVAGQVLVYAYPTAVHAVSSTPSLCLFFSFLLLLYPRDMKRGFKR